MRRGILERKIENIDTKEVLKRKRDDEVREDEIDEEAPPVSRQRRASILPGTLAYNEAIMASFDAIDLVEPESDDQGSIEDDPSPKDVDDSGSEPPIYTVDEPPGDDSVSDSEHVQSNNSLD